MTHDPWTEAGPLDDMLLEYGERAQGAVLRWLAKYPAIAQTLDRVVLPWSRVEPERYRRYPLLGGRALGEVFYNEVGVPSGWSWTLSIAAVNRHAQEEVRDVFVGWKPTREEAQAQLDRQLITAKWILHDELVKLSPEAP